MTVSHWVVNNCKRKTNNKKNGHIGGRCGMGPFCTNRGPCRPDYHWDFWGERGGGGGGGGGGEVEGRREGAFGPAHRSTRMTQTLHQQIQAGTHCTQYCTQHANCIACVQLHNCCTQYWNRRTAESIYHKLFIFPPVLPNWSLTKSNTFVSASRGVPCFISCNTKYCLRTNATMLFLSCTLKCHSTVILFLSCFKYNSPVLWWEGKKKDSGGSGYRSRYLSHAKRALYHLS